MKRFIIFSILSIISFASFAQVKDPVAWKYEAVKKSAGVYELVITATLPKPWHIYSQTTGKGPVATKFNFKANPLVKTEGTVKEEGKLQKNYDELFKSEVAFYADKVVFKQAIKVKGNIKTNVAGTVDYMVCNDEMCLPPTKKSFDIKLM